MKLRTKFMAALLGAVVAGALTGGLNVAVLAQDCVDYTDYLRWRCCIETRSYTEGTTVAGDRLYVADQTGVAIYDLTVPDEPVYLGGGVTPGRCMDVEVVGNYAYAVDLSLGFHVFDITNPAVPVLVGAETASGEYLYDVCIAGDRAYLADYGNEELRIVDIADPADPQNLLVVELLGQPTHVDVVGDHAYVVDTFGRLTVIELDEDIGVVGWVDLPSWLPLGVVVVDDLAYVADYDQGLQVVDVSTPTAPVIVGSLATFGDAFAVKVVGDRAYVTESWPLNGLEIVDISTPTSPVSLGHLQAHDDALDVAIHGDHAYVADFRGYLLVAEVGTASLAEFAGSVVDDNVSGWVATAGDHAYVADQNFGLSVVDITDPATATVVGSLAIPPGAFDVVVDGSQACLSVVSGGMRVVDVADPMNPSLLGSLVTSGQSRGIDRAGDLVCIAAWNWGLHVVDVSDPEYPDHLGNVYQAGNAVDVAMHGNHAYVAYSFYGLKVVDISDPEHPTFVGELATPDHAVGVRIFDGIAYVALEETGFMIVDISDPTTPTSLATVPTPGQVSDVAVADGLAYVADGVGGLQIVDLDALDGSPIIGSLPTPSQSAGSIALAGDRICVGQWGLDSALQIVWRQCAAVAVDPVETPVARPSLAAYPNPFNPRVTVAFSLERDQRVELAVYAVDGRHVVDLAGGLRSAGDHAVTWDGRSASGRSLPSGAYFVRLLTDDRVETHKVTLVR